MRSPRGGSAWDIGAAPPAPVPYQSPPGAVGILPGSVGQPQAEDLNAATLALGDPVADQAYYRSRNPRDLVFNAGAFRGGQQVTELRGFSNDAVPRRTADLASPADYLIAQSFEALVLDMNVDFQAALSDVGLAWPAVESVGPQTCGAPITVGLLKSVRP